MKRFYECQSGKPVMLEELSKEEIDLARHKIVVYSPSTEGELEAIIKSVVPNYYGCYLEEKNGMYRFVFLKGQNVKERKNG